MRSVVLVFGLTLISACTIRIPPADGGIDCLEGQKRSCIGGCNDEQECVDGAWAACKPGCGAGLACVSNTCVCTPGSCAGCCAGNVCRPGDEPQACGSAGHECTTCPGTETCSSGTCSGCATTCAGCCSGSACKTSALTSCGAAGAACAACDSTRADSCAAGGCACGSGTECNAGQRCIGGACVCDATSCGTGCCSGTTCVTPVGIQACGVNGGTCSQCDPIRTDTCTNGQCACGTSAPCPIGQTCSGGTCGTACGSGPACTAGQRCVSGACVCDATSCANGCCENTTCRTASITTCGSAGSACTTCNSSKSDRCELGACRCGSAPACSATQLCMAGSGSVTTTAVSFDDQQDRLVLPQSAWVTSTRSWTFASWVRIVVDRNQYSAFFTIEQPAGHSVEYNELVTTDDGTTLVFWDHSNGAAVTLGQLTVGTWYFAVVSVGANGAASAWLAPQGGALVKRTGTIARVDHVEMSYIGASNFAFTEFVNGSMAMARLWNGVLSDAEVAAEFTSTVPVRTTGLIGDWRFTSSTTVTADSSGLGHDLIRNQGATHGNATGPSLSGGARVCSP